MNVDGCERFIEMGNLVFIQYNRDASGALTPLAKKHVDTGSGLERIAAAMQSIETGKILGNYDIDLFQTIIKSIERAADHFEKIARGSDRVISVKRYGDSVDTDVSFRAIADHARAISFLIADGVIPGNTDREYVLRRLIRRAARHGRRIGFDGPFLFHVCQSVIDAMGPAYSELYEKSDTIIREVDLEEERFGKTLNTGLLLLGDAIKQMRLHGKHTLPGDVAFKLYDTYGFPLDLTQDVLREEGFDVDVLVFDILMEEQRVRSRVVRTGLQSIASGVDQGLTSQFIGYHSYEGESEVLLCKTEGDIHQLVVAETPFYPEGGGQVGDRGVIEAETGAIFEVFDTRKSGGSILHVGRILRGDRSEFLGRARVKLKVDRLRRDAAMLNHSATHILHYALRDVLGNTVHQEGSLVDPDKLRFDFAHTGPVKDEALATIEEEINARIRENAAVTVEEMAYDDAIKAGALAFFSEKYGDRVRVVRMGDFSVELCGGTHISRTGDVGMFKLEAESGVAAGVRRIEAVTGQGALETIRKREKILEEIGAQLGARDGAAIERLEKLLAREKELEKKLRAMEQKLASGAGGESSEENVREIGGVKVVTRKLDGVDPRTMREMADRMRQKHGSAVVALGSDLGEGKAALLVAVTPDLTSKIKAGDIIKNIAPIVDGTGGGRPDLAQAGGRDASKLDEALAKVATLVH